MTTPTKLYLTEAQVSARIGVSRPSLIRWRKAGIGPSWTRLGPVRIGYDAEKLSAWLHDQERAPIAA